MPAIASTLLSCLLGLVPLPPRLQIDVVFQGLPMRSRIEASATAEVAGIWAAHGVDVHASSENDEERNGAVRLAVVLADQPSTHLAAGALGSILFVDGMPRPTIVMYLNAIDALVSSATVMGLNDRQLTTEFRDSIVGRVLGRVLAHEIGHYLLRSQTHSREGLMRALQAARDLVGQDRQYFALAADQVTRIHSVVTQVTRADNPN
jgi:hypothetical protein